MGIARVADGRLALRIDALLLTLLWIGTLFGWSALPDRFPVHFDATGEPDRWATRNAGGFVLWLLLPLLATLTSVVMRAVSRWAMRNPAIVNVPEKRAFLALSDAERAPVLALVRRLLAQIVVCTTLLLAVTQLSIFLAARSSDGSSLLSTVAIIALVALMIGLALTTNVRAKRMIRSLSRSRSG